MIKSHGNIKKTQKWNTTTVKFSNGNEKKLRKQVKPDNSWTFTFTGLQAERMYLEDFFYARGGDFEPFFYTINNIKTPVRFAGDSIDFDEVREVGKPVAYSTQVTLTEYKE